MFGATTSRPAAVCLGWIGLLAILTAWGGTPAAADTTQLEPARDNTLYEDDLGELSNGVGDHLFAGRTAATNGNRLRRAVLAFDLGAIPAGSTITNATLRLRLSRTFQAGPTPVSLHRLLADWGEAASDASGNEGGGDSAETGDATWLHRFFADVLWTTAGGDFVGTASATTEVGTDEGTFYEWSSSELAADVQGWLDDPSSNFGWIVVGSEESPTTPTAKRYDSRDITQPDRRPQLVVDYLPPGATGACCFDDGTCTVLGPAACGDAGGDYQGDGTTCDPNRCPQPTGACCLDETSCVELTGSACAEQQGAWQGPGTDCRGDPCAGLAGACCFSGAVCLELGPAACAKQGGAYQGNGTTCQGNVCPLALEPYVDPLPIPGVLEPVGTTPEGAPRYDVAMTRVQQQLHRDLAPTTVWGYAGTFPGPVIEVTSGEPVEVRWINDLRDDEGGLLATHDLPVDTCVHGAFDDSPRTVVHLHGGHVPADVDGYPEDWFLPGEEAVYDYPNDQLPAMLWFHDHALGITRLNVYMGLAGIYIVRDAVEQGLGLPADDHEIPLVVQDRSFHANGSFAYPDSWQEHFFGAYVLVNGMVWPYLDVDRGKYRFRVLNGSNSRTYTFTIEGPRGPVEFRQIGTDGGLLPAPVALTELTLASGERADLVVDFEPFAADETLELVNSAPAPFPGTPGVGVVPQVMQFRVREATGFTDPLPERLRDVAPLLEEEAVRTRDFLLRKEGDPCTGTRWLINGLVWDEITEYPQLDSTEVWRFINRSGIMHPMHLHLDFFQVLDRQAFELDGDEIVPVGDPVPPPPNETGWKDTAQVAPFEILRVVAQFNDYTGKFPYHCHILEHEDHEMMRQVQVVDCPADTDGNGTVDVDDLVAVILDWGAVGPNLTADVNKDGVVNVDDLVEVILAWGSCPGVGD